MSKPKELNFFVEELNWDLGLDWYASRFDDRFEVRGESSPHYTNLPRFEGVAERIHGTARTRDCSTWCATRSSGSSPTGSTRPAPATRPASWSPPSPTPTPPTSTAPSTGCSCSPTWSASSAPRSRSSPRRSCSAEREATMRRAFAFAGVDEAFNSEHFDREWEKSGAKEGDKYQLMERLIKLPGLRSFDRNFDRLPESLRWRSRSSSTIPRSHRRRSRSSPTSSLSCSQPLRRGRCRPAEVRRPRVRRLARLQLSAPRRVRLGPVLSASFPIPGPATVEQQLDAYRPGSSRTRTGRLWR